MFVVVGTTTVDFFVRGMPDFAGSGDGFQAANVVFCEEPLLMLVGGNGANSAYILGKLGATTTLCSSIGQDDLGDWLVRKLGEQQINLSGMVRQTNQKTSSSTILQIGTERQMVYHHLGATKALEISDTQKGIYKKADVLLISSYSLFPQMRATGFAEAMVITHESGGIVGVDIGPAIGTPVKRHEIAPLFPFIDYLIANAHELRVCTDAADWETGAKQLLAEGCRCVVIKRGAEGASVRANDINLDLPAYPISANISVGAGDSFNAGFLFACWEQRPLLDALRFGSAVAGIVVAGQQGVLSAPTSAEVEQFLNS